MPRVVRLISVCLLLAAIAAAFPVRAQDCPSCPPPQGGIFQPAGECCPDCRQTRVYRSEILGRLWVQGEYLVWGLKPQHTEPLITTSPVGTLPGDAGVLGRSDARVLFGDQDLPGGLRSGGRITGGFWWTPEQLGGIEASYFELDEEHADRLFVGQGDTILARPFFDVTNGRQSSLLVGYPGVFDGSVAASVRSAFSGAEALLRQSLVCESSYRLDVVAGYRYLRLADRLEINQSQTALDASSGFSPGTLIDRYDLFDTVNQFHGGEVGLIARWWRNYVALEVQGKLALGGTSAETTIDGLTAIDTTIGGQPFFFALPGGLLAQPTNMGQFTSGRFAAMSELRIALELALTCQLRLSVGYDLVYWSRVARALDQVDRGINPSQIPPDLLSGVRRPEPVLRTTDFWAQGLTLGLVYQF